jgi:hypothetical protein
MSKNFINVLMCQYAHMPIELDDVMIMNHQTYRNTIVKHQYEKNESLKVLGFTLSALSLVEDIGVEPMTPCVQGRCSDQLS